MSKTKVGTREIPQNGTGRYKTMLEQAQEAHKNGAIRLQQLDAARTQLRDQLVGLEAQIQLLSMLDEDAAKEGSVTVTQPTA